MNKKSLNLKLFTFLNNSPTPYHAVGEIVKILEKSGFHALSEKERWQPEKGQPYYIIREDGALVAFNIGNKKISSHGFKIVGAHSDSPCLQIKPKPDLYEKSYHKLGVEVYGGALLAPWFDRELSIAGRVCYQTKNNEIKTNLINFNRPVAIIPSLAIHLDRNANKEKSINSQKDISLLFGLGGKSNDSAFKEHLIEQIKKEHKDDELVDILGFDLFCHDYHKACFTGIDDEFIVSGRLDNLLSCFISTQAIITADRSSNFMFICNSHEEIGSTSTSGAQSNLALSVFERLLPETDSRYTSFAQSFFISIDNAHATHPNFSDKSDPSHNIQLNYGPVLKLNANKRYASSSRSSGYFKLLCKEVNVKFQEFVMRNDMACGSTIGPMTSAKLGVNTVDIGTASLAMHSIRELTGSEDPYLMFKVVQQFFNKKALSVVES